MNRHGFAVLGLAAVVVAVTGARVASAADRHWNVGSGLWSSTTSWSPSGIPSGLDNAVVDYFGAGAGGFARLNTSPVPAVTSVTVTNSSTVTFSGSLTAGSLLVGNDFIVGSNNLHGALNIVSSNPFTVFTGGMTVVNRLRVGVTSGAGTVNQNAGTVIVGTAVVLGDSKDPLSAFNPGGTYYLSGSGLLRTPQLNVGSHLTGTGSFNLSGGRLDVTDVFVGGYGVGVFNQAGGITAPTDLRIGAGLSSPPPGNNVYNMTGGSLDVGRTTIVRNGVFNYTGGDAWLGHLNLYANARVDVNGPGLETYTMHFQDADVQAVIDVKGNGFDVGFSGFEQFDEIRDSARLGRNGGAWNGKGLISSVAAANSTSPHPTGVGYAPGGIGVIVRHAYYGDANVDGTVDLADFAALGANFNAAGRHWYHADFNYDGLTGIADFSLLAANFNLSLPPAGVSTARPATGVPEPLSVASSAAAGLAWLLSGRRRSAWPPCRRRSAATGASTGPAPRPR